MYNFRINKYNKIQLGDDELIIKLINQNNKYNKLLLLLLSNKNKIKIKVKNKNKSVS